MMGIGSIARWLLVLTVATAVYGFAASFNLDAGMLTAFALDGKGCQEQSLTTTLNDDGVYLTSVDVGNIASACLGTGASVQVVLVDGSGTIVGAEEIESVTASPTQQVDFSSQSIEVATVTTAHAIIPKSS